MRSHSLVVRYLNDFMFMIRSKSTTLSHSCLTDAVVVYGWKWKIFKDGWRRRWRWWENKQVFMTKSKWGSRQWRLREGRRVKRCQVRVRWLNAMSTHARQQRMLFLNYSTRYAKQSLCLGGGLKQIWIRGKDMRNEKHFSFLFFLRSLFSVG